MALLICEKIGLEKDPYLYFLNHDGGSHVFSIILLDYLKRFPKEIEETFQDYFNKLLTTLPIGEFDKEISRIKEEMHI